MRVDVKPLTHWAIYKGYRMRFTERSAGRAAGVLILPEGAELSFRYDAAARVVYLPGEHIRINDYGWELEHSRDETARGETASDRTASDRTASGKTASDETASDE